MGEQVPADGMCHFGLVLNQLTLCLTARKEIYSAFYLYMMYYI